MSTGSACSSSDPPFENAEGNSRNPLSTQKRSPGKKGRFFCTKCKPAPHTGGHTFNATGALKHEKSPEHKKAQHGIVCWGGNGVDAWGYEWAAYMGPLEKLGYDMGREKLPVRKRVRYWIKDMARAEGYEVEDVDEDVDEVVPNLQWDDWATAKNDWGSGGDDQDWRSLKPLDECFGFVPRRARRPKKRTDDEVDPRAAADFKFVERVARARGLEFSNRLHQFYRLPTEEKISRIQEIVHFIACHEMDSARNT
ncbi:hypothetical protein JB92DRAFT_3092547 [Gautieria morchelliformis]|nr:hypothetical protein JB92DRAFT_3092547 [Gautieria morchelliformis]